MPGNSVSASEHTGLTATCWDRSHYDRIALDTFVNPPSFPPSPRRDIQGLRALSVLAVIGAHTVGWPRGGFVGVDVFFVISGFVITAALLRELTATGRVRLRAFAARRVTRILPAALVVLVATVTVAFVVFHRSRAEQTLLDALSAAGMAANWRMVAVGSDYFHAGDAVSPLQHFWSLAVEEQFYLVWPVLLLIVVAAVPRARRAGSAALAVGATALIVVTASFVWALVQSTATPTLAYFSTFTRAWEFAVGALVACASPLLRLLPASLGAMLSWVGLAGIVAALVVIDPETTGFPAPWAALPVAGAALIMAGGVPGDPRNRHLFPLTNPASVAIGNMSYSLYLWHFPLIAFAAVILPTGGISTGIVLGATAALAIASYHLVEQPFRHLPASRRPASAPTTPAVSEARTVAEATAEPTLPPMRSTRPAGWTPGARYYPGGPQPRAVSAAASSVSSSSASPAPAAPPAAAQLAGPQRRAAIADSDQDQQTEAQPDGPTGRPATWSAWRARFAPAALLSTAGLTIAGLVVVFTVQTAFGGLTAPATAGAPQADSVQSDGSAPTDFDPPVAILQTELADAASATQWPELHPSLDEVIARSSATNPVRDCFSPDRTPDAGSCSIGSADAPDHIYLVGDSTAMAYAPTLRAIASASDGSIRVTTVGLYGCRFTDVAVQNDGAGVMEACPQRKADVRAMIAADTPTLVVISNAYTLGHAPNGTDLSADALLAAQQAEADTYGMPGRIVHLAPPPEGQDLARCYSPASPAYACTSGVSTTWNLMEAAAERVAAASGDHAISSLPFVCWESRCPAFAGGIPTRYDRTHLTVAYAEHIAPALRAELAARGLLQP